MNIRQRISGVTMALAAVCVAASCGGSGSPAGPTAPPVESPTPAPPAPPTPPPAPPPGASFVSIIMYPPSGGALTTGYSRQLGASFKLPSGEYTNCAASVVWASSDPAIATVSAQGVIAGVSAGTVTISATCLGAVGTLSLPVYRSVTLSGIVTDDRGAPLPGAYVWARDSKYGHSTKTEANGRYRLDGLPGTARVEVWVGADGYEDFRTEVTLADMTMDFSLRQGFIVGGWTREVGGAALGGVTVEVVAGTNAGTSNVSTSWGAYGLHHLLPGTFVLRASKPGYVSEERSVTASKYTAVNFELTPVR